MACDGSAGAGGGEESEARRTDASADSSEGAGRSALHAVGGGETSTCETGGVASGGDTCE